MKSIHSILILLLFVCPNLFSFAPSNEEANSRVGITSPGFIENKGQLCDMNNKSAPYLLFKLQDRGTDVYITETGFSFVFKSYEEKPENSAAGEKNENLLQKDKFKQKDMIVHFCRADMELVGAEIRTKNIIKENPSEDYSNYYLSHCPGGVMEVRSYGKIIIKEVYPGIDWVIYNTASGGMKYDFVVHQYADASQIKMRYSGTDKSAVNNGDITHATPLGKITESKPCGLSAGNSVNLDYNITGNDISFQTGEFDTSEMLVMDFQLVWATYYGGSSGDEVTSINSDGNSLWLTGDVQSLNFPLQSVPGSYNQGTYGGGIYDAFVLKFNLSGSRQWATYYGGASMDLGYSINSDGTNVWVTGITYSTDFPVLSLSGAYNQGALGGGTCDPFILKFNTSGIRQWATYYGGSGSGNESGNSIFSNGSFVWVTGVTPSADFPVLQSGGAYNQSALDGSYDAFILMFNTQGLRQWATFYGGNYADAGNSITCDGSHVWATGSTSSSLFPFKYLPNAYNQDTNYANVGDANAFILRFGIAGTWEWATVYGGFFGSSYGNEIQSDGNIVYITGRTNQPNFRLQPLSGAYNQSVIGGLYDAFILKFNSSGVRQWATYYGGVYDDYGMSIHTNGSSVFVAGHTRSSNFPLQVLPGVYNQDSLHGYLDAFILKFDTSGVRNWATYYGGYGDDAGASIFCDTLNLWLSGYTSSSDFHLQYSSGSYNQSSYGGNYDAFIMRFSSNLTGSKQISDVIPKSYSLSQNYPNPFNPSTNIKFEISKTTSVKLNIYDVLGREIAVLVNEELKAGTYSCNWDATNLSSGVYYYKLSAGDFNEAKKMLLIK